MNEFRDLVSALLLVVGSIMSLSAAIGLLRFPDVLSRMHAATKPQVFGLMCVLLAIGLQFAGWATISTLVVVILFQMLTAPVSAHMVGRAAYRTKHVRGDTLLVDELAGAIAKAERRKDAQSSDEPAPGERAAGERTPGERTAGERTADPGDAGERAGDRAGERATGHPLDPITPHDPKRDNHDTS